MFQQNLGGNIPCIWQRYTTADHRETIRINDWDFWPVDIMDEDGAVMIPVKAETFQGNVGRKTHA